MNLQACKKALISCRYKLQIPLTAAKFKADLIVSTEFFKVCKLVIFLYETIQQSKLKGGSPDIPLQETERLKLKR